MRTNEFPAMYVALAGILMTTIVPLLFHIVVFCYYRKELTDSI